VMLNDWSDVDPTALFSRLKKMSDYDNFYKRTAGDFFRDVKRIGLKETLQDRKMWGEMRMTPTDLSDVNANTYTYLMNGKTSAGNWTGLFRPGEKVRLRFINGSAMTHFDVRIPGLKMTVVAADGQYVHPVSVDEFRIAVAEVLDVIVEPSGQEAFTIFAQDIGRTGYVSGTLAVRAGLRAPVPAVDPRPVLTMDDMGHGHGMSGMNGMDHSGHSMHAGHDMSKMMNMDHGGHGKTKQGMDHDSGDMQQHPAGETGNPLVDMQTMLPLPKLECLQRPGRPRAGAYDRTASDGAYGEIRLVVQWH
jgi:CopA family copper-resistance protein